MVGMHIILEPFKKCLTQPILNFMFMKQLSVFLVCLLLIACSEKKFTISDFAWLEGKWEGTSEKMNFFEEWNSINGNSMHGKGGAISGADTVFSESIKIEQRGEEVFYIPNVKENGGAVDFKFVGLKNDSIVFENPLHDFPQRIVYFRLPNNKLYACIDGLNAGKYERIEFSYEKTK